MSRDQTTQSSRLKPGSQNARIVEALAANGGWMTTAQLHRQVGFCRLNSRAAELRGYGYDIPTRHVPGQTGPDATEYMLAGTPEDTAGGNTAAAGLAVSSGASADGNSASLVRHTGEAPDCVQLDLFEAAA